MTTKNDNFTDWVLKFDVQFVFLIFTEDNYAGGKKWNAWMEIRFKQSHQKIDILKFWLYMSVLPIAE